MALEINKELVTCTSHIRHTTARAIEAGVFVDYSGDGCAFRLYVNGNLDNDATIQHYPELKSLLELAKQHDCKWLVLDCDGDEIEGYETFDW